MTGLCMVPSGLGNWFPKNWDCDNTSAGGSCEAGCNCFLVIKFFDPFNC